MIARMMYWYRIARAGLACLLLGFGPAFLVEAQLPRAFSGNTNFVGRVGTNFFVTPTGQILTPAGRQIELPKMRPQVLALSPNKLLLATAGQSNVLVLIDTRSGQIRQTLRLSVTNQVVIKPRPPKAKAKKSPPKVPAATPKTPRDPAATAVSNDQPVPAAASAPDLNATPDNANPPKTAEEPDPGSQAGPGDASTSTNTAPHLGTNAIAQANTSTNSAPTNTTTNVTFTAQMSLTGLAFSPNGKRLYFSNVGGDVWVFAVDSEQKVTHLPRLVLPDVKRKDKKEIPAGLAVSANGRRLYVAGNLGNRLFELDADTGAIIRIWETGMAPFDVVLAAGKAYVSNLGGRRPGKGDLKASAGRGTQVRVDPVRHIASEGSVTVIDLATGLVKDEIMVGLHASAMAVSPDGKYVVVANTGSDTLSVIDTRRDQVVEQISARQTPADLFGAQPNALAFDRGGKRLYVCNGTQNAVAVVEFDPKGNDSAVSGLIPTGWFPGAVQFDSVHNQLYVANIKGIGAWRPFKTNESPKYVTRDFYGLVSLIPLPSKRGLENWTRTALRNMRYPKLAEAKLPPRPGQPARPVPERVGEPSLFKHVIYVIKENRSYDQVLGDMKEGNGDTNLCIFGEKYTPNQHKIAREFVLLDNTYCSGVQSADGHQWTDSSIANEYVERQLTADFPRSYSSGKTEDGLDALSWASSGFIWDNALAHGKTFRNYGEWMLSQADWKVKKGHKNKPTWMDFWYDIEPEFQNRNRHDQIRLWCLWALHFAVDYPRDLTHLPRRILYAKTWWPRLMPPEPTQTRTNLTRLASKPGIPSMRGHSATNTVGWDLDVPDIRRAAEFIKELRQYETKGGFPELILLFLPNDHTGGTRGRSPTPGAQVADNDLAFGRVVEAVSHSKFWADTCILAIEDDPQAGWDHVSGYRTTCYVASAYTKRRQTISTQYNQASLVRTIELILGLPPMNQLDASATPMSDCFTSTADLTPFNSTPNLTPLDEINPDPAKIASRVLRQDAIVSASLPLDEPDRCPEDTLNRILWRAMKGPDLPYPEWAVKLVADND